MTDIITTGGKNVILNRAYKSTVDYTQPSKFRLGVDNGTPVVSDTDLDKPVPIVDGVVNDDGTNNLTGSGGGDNTTDNTNTYKPGAGVSDDTAQNLIANGTNITKSWSLALTTFIDLAKYCGLWIYIKDQTTLDKIRTSPFSVQIVLGSDSTNFYYYNSVQTLSIGWNWITQNEIVNDWSENGTVSGNVDYFRIRVYTKNATDTFVAGDVIYDLLRTWDRADTLGDFSASYPTFDEVNNKVTIRCYLDSTKANGFLLNAVALENEDGTPIMTDISDYKGASKSDTDEFAFMFTNKLE